MAKTNLIRVAVSVTMLSNDLKRLLEPRTSSGTARIKVIRNLTATGIPVTVMAAPIIPLINDKELEKILQRSAEAGAEYAGYVLIRLPHEVKDLFREWLNTHFPERAAHVMSLIQQMRGGKDYDATFGKRMRGEGEFARLIENRFNLACKRFGLNVSTRSSLDTSQFRPKASSAQLDFFN